MMWENRQKSQKQEKRITKSFNELLEGRARIASGNQWFCKGDYSNEMFLLEAKTKASPSKSMSLKKEWFDKIELEAFQDKKIPLLAFSFGDGTDYIALKERYFLELVEELLELRREKDE